MPKFRRKRPNELRNMKEIDQSNERVMIVKNFHGICHMIVCVEKDATNDEILEMCNRENPSGTSLGWCKVVREENEDPNRNPVPCDEIDNRLHILIGC